MERLRPYGRRRRLRRRSVAAVEVKELYVVILFIDTNVIAFMETPSFVCVLYLV